MPLEVHIVRTDISAVSLTATASSALEVCEPQYAKRLDFIYRVQCDEPSESGLKSSANRAEEALKNAEEADRFG